MDDSSFPRESPSTTHADIANLAMRVQQLDELVARLRLFNQALWEMLCEQEGFNPADLERRIAEIDGRDGRIDGRLRDLPLKCPQCGRVSNSRRSKCVYCGLEFERTYVV